MVKYSSLCIQLNLRMSHGDLRILCDPTHPESLEFALALSPSSGALPSVGIFEGFCSPEL